jgi:hypothetical protein
MSLQDHKSLLHGPGTILDVLPLEQCGQYIVKGYAQQLAPADAASADITVSIAEGSVVDCSGQAFPRSSVTSAVPNRFNCLVSLWLWLCCLMSICLCDKISLSDASYGSTLRTSDHDHCLWRHRLSQCVQYACGGDAAGQWVRCTAPPCCRHRRAQCPSSRRCS